MKSKPLHLLVALLVYGFFYGIILYYFGEGIPTQIFWSQVFIFGFFMALAEVFVFDKLRKRRKKK